MNLKLQSRRKLLDRIRKKNLFWSYNLNVDTGEISDEILMEVALKYGDLTDLKILFESFGRDAVYDCWVKHLLPDKRFRKLNFYLARVVFDVNWEKLSSEKQEWSRFEKLRLLASRN